MIHTVEQDGCVLGEVVCGNTTCGKVLQTFEGYDNEPDPVDHGYLLLNVVKQVLFTDSFGRPLRTMPAGNPASFLGVSVAVNLDDRVVGYRHAPDSQGLMEDFCSDRCASEFLKNNREWNLCLRQLGGGAVLFVAHVPERFTVEQVRVEWPPKTSGDAPQLTPGPEEPAASDTKELLYYGHRLTLKRSAIARCPGEDPEMIALVTHVSLLCPLGKLNECSGQIEPCSKPIQLILDLAPSAFLCPYCFGLIFVDQKAHSTRYRDADFEFSIDSGQSFAGYATYPNHKGQAHLNEKIQKHTSGQRVLVAIRLTDDLAQMLGLAEGRINVMPSSCDEKELDSQLPVPSALADFICQSSAAARQEGRFWEAIALAQRALVIEPESASAHFLVGDASDELGMLESAVQAYQAALRIQPRFAQAHVNLGIVYERQENWPDAMRQYQAALRIDPDLAQAHYCLGALYGRQGRTTDEMREYQAALRTDPNHVYAHYNLGITYYQQGQRAKAIPELRAAAKLGFEPARQVLAQLGYA